MTQTSAEPTRPLLSDRLRDTRERAGLTLDQAATATGLPQSHVGELEAGRRRPLPGDLDRLAGAYGTDLSGLLPERRPVEVDAGRISLAGRSRRVPDTADDREVYAAYLFLLYAVRGAAPGQRMSLRSSDVELLMGVVGDDAETIEHRLVRLMGSTPVEATRLRTVLLRHRAAAAAAGTAAALSWVVVVAPAAPADAPRPAQASATSLSGGTSGAAYYDLDAVDGGVTPVVEDVLDGAWSPAYPAEREAKG